jgi:hypothetical protein
MPIANIDLEHVTEDDLLDLTVTTFLFRRRSRARLGDRGRRRRNASPASHFGSRPSKANYQGEENPVAQGLLGIFGNNVKGRLAETERIQTLDTAYHRITV